MSANVDNGYDRLPQHFRDHPRAYDLWQAYVLLESCASEGDDDWRFGFPASLSFPVSEIEEMRQEEDALRLDVTLPGVFGPDGPLPPDFRETVIQERNEGNRALQDFIDIFLNRLMRLWMADASAMCPELGVVKTDGEDLPYAFFGTLDSGTAEVWEMRGGWLAIPVQLRTRLGVVNTRLGVEAIAGKMIFEGVRRAEMLEYYNLSDNRYY